MRTQLALLAGGAVAEVALKCSCLGQVVLRAERRLCLHSQQPTLGPLCSIVLFLQGLTLESEWTH